MEKKWQTALTGLVLLAGVTWGVVATWPDGKVHVYMCDVGQGDAILVSWNWTQMLVDGGPNERVLECLTKHIPFYDRKLEAVVLTHPQADHMGGLIPVMQRYSVEEFVTVNVSNQTNQFAVLTEVLRERGISPKFIRGGDRVQVAGNGSTVLSFDIIWPSWEFLMANTKEGDPPSSWRTAEGQTDLNSFAIVGKLSYGNFSIMLTGDADSKVDLAIMATGLLKEAEVLKVPHHGSKTGMLPEFLEVVSPKLCVISVGKNNRYGHPAPETVKMVSDYGCRLMRTDIDGEVEVVSDGEGWWVDK